MRLVFGLVLVIGVGLAGFAAYMAKNYIDSYQTQLARERAAKKPPIELGWVYVVKRAVKYGEKLTPEDVELIQWPKKYIPEGTFTKAEPVFPEGVDDPRFVIRAMEKWEPVLAVKVTEPGEEAGLISRLEKGMRAFAIKVDVASGVSGFLRPGDIVDVYWTGRVETGGADGSSISITKLIESGVKIIAVDQKAGRDAGDIGVARTVTVAVRPQQVAALAQAQSTGRLSLSLVGSEDDVIAEAIEVDQASLLGIEKAPEAQPEAEPERICTVRTRRGAEMIEIPIPCTN